MALVSGLYGGQSETAFSYWQLTPISGHSGPRTPTGDYDHLGSTLLGVRILEAEAAFSPESLLQITGWFANRVTRLLNASNLPGGMISAHLVRERLSKDVTCAIPGTRVRRPAAVKKISANRKTVDGSSTVSSWYAVLKGWKLGGGCGGTITPEFV